MKNGTKTILIILMLIGLLSAVILYRYRHRIINRIKRLQQKENITKELGSCPGCAILFPDNVAKHEKAYARGEGITPQRTDAGLIKLLKQNTLLKLKSNEYYIIRPMLHAKPYILPKGKKFITALAALYAQKCKQRSQTEMP